MIAVIQRCSSSSVRIDNKKISEISYGLTVLLGIVSMIKKKMRNTLQKNSNT
ncbi:MAG: hypothetical protein CM15mP44_3530 [Candidatus Neomarinimicrobiota bacterium]|nr:MAG: hypothetical protein CM15mP44_3530 [Candidatus Neomarinimicrobiota bacterium]